MKLRDPEKKIDEIKIIASRYWLQIEENETKRLTSVCSKTNAKTLYNKN